MGDAAHGNACDSSSTTSGGLGTEFSGQLVLTGAEISTESGKAQACGGETGSLGGQMHEWMRKEDGLWLFVLWR